MSKEEKDTEEKKAVAEKTETAPASDKIELKEGKKEEIEAEKLKQQLQEYKETLQRLQADFENYKKRVEREIITQQDYSHQQLIKKFLPILDSFELALKNTGNFDKFKKGVELIYAQFYSLLENQGLKAINAVGEQFDPYKHEALMQEESEKDNKILEEFQKGYTLKGAVIRHSKVRIGVKK
jgi:molecular chaperone GrpE